jgi:hypothetical protein
LAEERGDEGGVGREGGGAVRRTRRRGRNTTHRQRGFVTCTPRPCIELFKEKEEEEGQEEEEEEEQ